MYPLPIAWIKFQTDFKITPVERRKLSRIPRSNVGNKNEGRGRKKIIDRSNGCIIRPYNSACNNVGSANFELSGEESEGGRSRNSLASVGLGGVGRRRQGAHRAAKIFNLRLTTPLVHKMIQESNTKSQPWGRLSTYCTRTLSPAVLRGYGYAYFASPLRVLCVRCAYTCVLRACSARV